MNRTTCAQTLLRTFAAVLFSATLAACNQSSSEPASAGASSAASPAAAASTASPAAAASTAADPISFSSVAYSVSQSQGTVTLIVRRTGSDSSAVGVDYATENGTATAGTQYTATSGTLKWTENDATSRIVTIPISNARPFSGTKTFKVVLTDPSGQAQISSPGTATVTISGDAGESAGSLRFSSAGYQVAQAAGTLRVTVDRVGGAYGAVSVEYSTQTGTADAGTNFTATSGTLQWANGDATAKTFSVSIAHAAGFSGTKLFHVLLSSPKSGASLGTPSNALVTIDGEGTDAGSLVFSKSSYSVAQTAGKVTISVDRIDGSSGAASVAYSTSSATAAAGATFTGKSGTLQWASGDTSPKTFTVPVSDATPFTGNKTFDVALSSPSAGASIASPGKATVTIVGSAAPAVGSLALSASTYAVDQSAGTLTVTVDRTGGSSGPASVVYATSNGSAVAGTAYSAESGTLNWANGDASPKTFTIPIGTTPFSGNESFTVALSAASGATLASPSTALVTIAGDAPPPAPGSLALSSATYDVSQGSGTLTVTVDRTGGSSGAASIAYATSNGSAVAGTDYTATSGTLDWASGNSSAQSFSIPISNATPFSGSKSFTITLSAASGATLGSPSSATVTITGDAVVPTGTLQLSAATYAVSQSAGEATVVVERTAGSTGSISVTYATRDGTAVAGTDYTAVNGTLNWAAGNTASQSVQIPISTASPFSGSKSFTITLSSPSTGATLGSPGSATVTITGSSSGGSSSAAPPTNVMVIEQGTSATNEAQMYICESATSVCPGFSSTYTLYYGNDQSTSLNEIGWQGVSGATNYAIYRSTNGGTAALLTTISASTAESNYTGYVSSQSGNPYLTNINSTYTDNSATNVVSGMQYPPVNVTGSVTSGSNVFSVGTVNNNTSVGAPGVITAGQGISGPGIPTGTTIAAFGSGGTTGRGGAGTYELSQNATATASGQTYGTQYFVNNSYTYYVEAEVGGAWSSPSAYAILPYVVNGEYILSGGVFGGPAEQGVAPATTPLGYSNALEWAASNSSSDIGIYAGDSAADQALNIGGYSYLNVAFYTSTSGINFTVASEVPGDNVILNMTELSDFGFGNLTPNTWTTYKIPLNDIYIDKQWSGSLIRQNSLYKVVFQYDYGTISSTDIFMEMWFSVN